MDRSQDEGGEAPNSWAQGNTYNETKGPFAKRPIWQIWRISRMCRVAKLVSSGLISCNFFQKAGLVKQSKEYVLLSDRFRLIKQTLSGILTRVLKGASFIHKVIVPKHLTSWALKSNFTPFRRIYVISSALWVLCCSHYYWNVLLRFPVSVHMNFIYISQLFRFALGFRQK